MSLQKSPAPVSGSAQGLSRRDSLRLLGLMGLAGAVLPSVFGADSSSAAPALASAAPALSLAGPQSGYYRFRIGDIEALALSDGGFSAPPANSPWGRPGQTEALPALLEEHFLSPEQLRLPFNNLLVRLGSELVLVDAGCGGLFGPAGGRLVSNLAAAGVRPEQITGVIISHMHGDHFGGLLDAQGKPVFPKAKLFIHRKEHAHWSGLSATGPNADSIQGVQRYLKAFEGKWQLIEGGEKLVGGLEVIETFGHTPGHIAVSIASGKESLLHFVDVVHHHAVSFAHPEFIMGFDSDSAVAEATRRRVLDRAASERARVFGAHMPFPALGHVRRKGQAYEHVIEPWVSA